MILSLDHLLKTLLYSYMILLKVIKPALACAFCGLFLCSDQKQAALHDSLLRFLGDGDTLIERVYGSLYWADQSSQRMIIVSCTIKTGPTNQPRKDPFHLYYLSPHSPQFQQSAGATPRWSLWS
jgi:hypothetical protein